MWTAIVGEMFDEAGVLPLAIRTKRPLKEQYVSGEWMAARFDVQRLLFLGREGSFTGEEQRAVFVRKEVVQFGAKTKVDRRGGGQSADIDREETGVFGLPFHLDQATVGEFFQDALEGGDRDMGEAGKIFVTEGAAGFVLGMSQPPQAEVDDLFGGGEVRKELVDDFLHEGVVWRSPRQKSSVRQGVSMKCQSEPRNKPHRRFGVRVSVGLGNPARPVYLSVFMNGRMTTTPNGSRWEVSRCP
jgi:hypothetical protein